MLNLETLGGFSCSTPASVEEDNTPRFTTSDPPAKILNFYRDNGYVIIQNCLSQNNCESLRFFWDNEVKNSEHFIYRQVTAKLEKNKYNSVGFVINPILNLQSLCPNHFGGLRSAFTTAILGNRNLFKLSQLLLGDIPLAVQSMYFEGNSVTWEHQDSYYLDGETIGSMFGAWIALEDIDPTAGRFFISPKSHLSDNSSMDKSNNIASNHESYKRHILNVIKNNNLDFIAPALLQGDVLFWNSLTIHGSLNSSHPTKARNSITLHAIPSSSRFRVFRSHLRSLNYKTSSVGFRFFSPKDQNLVNQRILYYIERYLPKLFYYLKSCLIYLSASSSSQ